MKYILSIITILSFTVTITSCKKSSDNTSNTTPVVTNFDPSKATLISQGTFTGSGGHIVNGTVKLYDDAGKKYLYFENFTATSGPDLRVYISTNLSATQFVNISNLKSTTGTQAYLINTSPDFSQYNKILIWCQQFTVLFGSAALQ